MVDYNDCDLKDQENSLPSGVQWNPAWHATETQALRTCKTLFWKQRRRLKSVVSRNIVQSMEGNGCVFATVQWLKVWLDTPDNEERDPDDFAVNAIKINLEQHVAYYAAKCRRSRAIRATETSNAVRINRNQLKNFEEACDSSKLI